MTENSAEPSTPVQDIVMRLLSIHRRSAFLWKVNMIRMVKPGVVPEAVSHEWFGTCRYCSCEMLADEWPKTAPPAPPQPSYNNWFSTDSVIKPYDPEAHFCCKCMTCGEMVVLKKRDKSVSA
jgi:hypothetical protein